MATVNPTFKSIWPDDDY